MAHIAKYTADAAVCILRHMERTITYSSNKDVDSSRSHLNYRLCKRLIPYQYFKQRLSEVHVYNRKDVVVLCGWIITAPRDLPPEYHERFFRECYAFLNDRYGGVKNCVTGNVHMDESQPHMHYTFTPIVPDKKRGGEKVCAKEVLTREELRSFHPDLQAYLTKKGIPAKIINGATAAGNRTVAQLKRERAERERTREVERGVFTR